MFDDKTGSVKSVFTDIKRIRDLNASFQKELRKGIEVSIEAPTFLNFDDYELILDSKPHCKNIHLRRNKVSLLEYEFKAIPLNYYDEKTEKEIDRQVAILKELKYSEHIIKIYGIAKASDVLRYYLVTEWMEN
ncbi:20398_t:CDS:1, partial [Racocetra persica]